MRGHRESVVLARNTPTPRQAMIRMRRASSQEHDASSGSQFERLQTEYIDLYWVHIWDGITPVEEVMRAT